MTKKRTWTFALLAVALTVTLATSGLLAGKPPKDPPPPPDPPPVYYVLHRFSMPANYVGGVIEIGDINDEGEVVGYYDDPSRGETAEAPFYLDIYTGNTIPRDLNDLPFDGGPDPVEFPELDYRIPAGWYINSALDINNWGDIAVSIGKLDDPHYLRGGVIELRPDPSDASVLPRLHLLPEDPAWTHTYARHINDDGVVLGGDTDLDIAYVHRPGDPDVQVIPYSFDVWSNHNELTDSVNGPLVKVSTGPDGILTYDVNAGTTNFADASDYNAVIGFNDIGHHCGSYAAKRRGTKGYVFDGALHSLDDMRGAIDVNNSRDVVGISNGDRVFLDHATHGSIALDAVVVTANPEEQDIWDNGDTYIRMKLSERDLTGFPILAGQLWRHDSAVPSNFFDGYVLIPIP